MTATVRLALATLAGAALGAAGMKLATRPAPPAPATPAATPAAGARRAGCPVHTDATGGLQVDDQKETERLRQALRDGIFAPWTERGRAPTPDEFAQRMKLSPSDANALLDRLQACGESVGGGILRAPESELIA